MSLPPFRILQPTTVQGAVAYLAQYAENVRVLAGGTDLIPSMRHRLFEPSYILDLSRIEELKGIRVQPSEGVEIGALTTVAAVEHSAYLRRHYPVLSQAASTVASPVLRNMGTIGGNICLDTRCLWYNQSLAWRKACDFCLKRNGEFCHVAPGGKKCWAAFSGDIPPALLCLDAEIEIASASGLRQIPLREFYTGNGDKYHKLERSELITRVMLPEASADCIGAYRKLRIRGSIDFPLAGVAVAFNVGDGRMTQARVAITAVNPAPMLVKAATPMMEGQSVHEELANAVGDLAARTAKPLSTSGLTPEYRREMIRVFTKRAILGASSEIIQNCQGTPLAT